MAHKLETDFLRNASGREAADYLNKISGEASLADTTQQILQAVERESLLPITFAVWLGVTRSPFAIQQALKQRISLEIRKFGIKQLGKNLSSGDWRETWDELKGIPGLLELYSDLSVNDVSQLSGTIGASARGQDIEEKRQKFTELFKSLHSHLFSDSPFETSDRRPLSQNHRNLINGCTDTFFQAWVLTTGSNYFEGPILSRKFLSSFPETYRKEALRCLFLPDMEGEAQRLITLISQSASGRSHEPDFSPSMQFSLDILRRLANGQKPNLESTWLLSQLVQPLLKRALRKRISLVKIQEILDLTIMFLEHHPIVLDCHRILNEKLLRLVSRFWASRPEMFGTHLEKLLRKSAVNGADYEIQKFTPIVKGPSKLNRYELLEICFREINGIDLDDEGDLKRVKGALPDTLLLDILRTSDALDLFTRLRKSRGDDGLVMPAGPAYDSFLSSPASSTCNDGDPELWYAVLLHRNGFGATAEERAIEQMERSKEMAKMSSEQEERAFQAKAALCYAISSGSLRVVGDALDWSRRFLRDSLTAPQLFSELPGGTALLLSGIPDEFTETAHRAEIADRVREGNRILNSISEIVCLALREPSFSIIRWQGALRMFFNTTMQRIRGSTRLKKMLGLSDGELYQILWEDTIQTLLSVEEKLVQEEYAGLHANSIGGILAYRSYYEVQLGEEEEPATYRFIDSLARARDEFWCTLRPKAHPDVTTLPEAFPRGLPVQYLTSPFTLNIRNLEGTAPYIASRVKKTLFPDTRSVLAPIPTDRESWKAIGSFIDEYAVALRLYIPLSLEASEQRRRAEKAWVYATRTLSQDRMSSEEAARFWEDQHRNVLQDVWPPNSASKTIYDDDGEYHYRVYGPAKISRDWLLVPQVENPSKIEEWNPLPPVEERDVIPGRDLEKLTYIDLSKTICAHTSRFVCLDTELDRFTPQVPAREAILRGTWDSKLNWQTKAKWLPPTSRKSAKLISPALREGLVLSALLYLDTKLAPKSRILATPYPSIDECRYPALYLDDESLSDDKNRYDHALNALQTHLASVPLGLLKQVTEHAMTAMDRVASEPDLSFDFPLQNLAYELLKLLIRSDRPFLAMEISLNAILNRSDDSSWHRSLLPLGLLLKLPSYEAHLCLETFASAIIDRLNPGGHVKVTTAKILIELLRRPAFISYENALSALVLLSKVATQIDTRIALVRSLLAMFSTEHVEYSERILTVLETFIPLAGSLNEYQPMSESDWSRVEDTLELPEIRHVPRTWMATDTESPMLDALLAYYGHKSETPSFDVRFISRIILPTLELLKQQTARWVAVFLRKHGVGVSSLKEVSIPRIPRSIEVVKDLFNMGPNGYLPRTILEEYVDYMIFNIMPPAPIKELNEKFQSDPSLSSAIEIKTWLRLYGQGLGGVMPILQEPIQSLCQENRLDEDVGMTRRVIQEQILKLFTAILWNDGPRYFNLDHFTRTICSSGQAYWKNFGKDIVQAMVLYVETLRSEEWARDANRHPQVLPDVYALRLQLIDLPGKKDSSTEETDEEECKALAAQISKILDRLAGTLYAKKLQSIKTRLNDFNNSENDYRFRVALHLGDITKTRLSWLTQHDQLRLELAADMINSSPNAELNPDIMARTEHMLDSWKKSENEEIRRLGFTVSAPYSEQRQKIRQDTYDLFGYGLDDEML